MILNTNKRKGITLAEITVSLALIAVMITLTVSFVVMLTDRVRVNASHGMILGDVKIAEAAMENWIDRLSLEGASFIVSDDGGSLIAESYGEKYKLNLDGERFVGSLPNGDMNAVKVSSMKSVSFDVMEKDGDYIVFCKAVCENTETKKVFEYTFTVNSRIGERYD